MYRIKGGLIENEAVNDLLVLAFFGECPENSVPDY